MNNMRTFYFFILTFFFLFSAVAQENTDLLRVQEAKLDSLLHLLRSTKEDAILDKNNQLFRQEMATTLEMEGAFDFPFNKLSTVGKIYSQDQLVRIVSWNIQYPEKLSYDYFSFILKKDERRGNISVTELKRGGESLKMQQFETIGANNWYGALYYDIIDVERGRKTYYTVLGYNIENNQSHTKFIDVLYFTGRIPNFGYPLFKTKSETRKRLLFEHSAKATMSMRYDRQREKIIMDHLSPESPTLQEFREFYVPDMSYDAYEWNGKHWELLEDIIAVNKEKPKEIKLKAYDSKLDTVVEYSIKNKWENPSYGNSPIDGGGHKAIKPDDLDPKAQAKTRKKDKNTQQNNRVGKGTSNIQLKGVKKKKR